MSSLSPAPAPRHHHTPSCTNLGRGRLFQSGGLRPCQIGIAEFALVNGPLIMVVKTLSVVDSVEHPMSFCRAAEAESFKGSVKAAYGCFGRNGTGTLDMLAFKHSNGVPKFETMPPIK